MPKVNKNYDPFHTYILYEFGAEDTLYIYMYRYVFGLVFFFSCKHDFEYLNNWFPISNSQQYPKSTFSKVKITKSTERTALSFNFNLVKSNFTATSEYKITYTLTFFSR